MVVGVQMPGLLKTTQRIERCTLHSCLPLLNVSHALAFFFFFFGGVGFKFFFLLVCIFLLHGVAMKAPTSTSHRL
jgi:hypothetical protein